MQQSYSSLSFKTMVFKFCTLFSHHLAIVIRRPLMSATSSVKGPRFRIGIIVCYLVWRLHLFILFAIAQSSQGVVVPHLTCPPVAVIAVDLINSLIILIVSMRKRLATAASSFSSGFNRNSRGLINGLSKEISSDTVLR